MGNKSDLSSRREVPAAAAQDWAQSHGLDYYETSAVSLGCSDFIGVETTSSITVSLSQKEMENCEAPLLGLAQVFHALYLEHRQSVQNLSPA